MRPGDEGVSQVAALAARPACRPTVLFLAQVQVPRRRPPAARPPAVRRTRRLSATAVSGYRLCTSPDAQRVLNERVDSNEPDRDRQPGVAGIGKWPQPDLARWHVQAAQGYPTEHGGNRQPNWQSSLSATARLSSRVASRIHRNVGHGGQHAGACDSRANDVTGRRSVATWA